MTALEMKRSVEDLRQRTQDAEENVAKMRKELRAKKLQTDSVTRELKHMTLEAQQNAKNLESAESSRQSLLQELERTRGDKTIWSIKLWLLEMALQMKHHNYLDNSRIEYSCCYIDGRTR